VTDGGTRAAGVQTAWIDLAVDDGTTLRAWTARPEGSAPTRGLVVFQEAFGVNAHIRDVTARFAAADPKSS
jgi:carboxymethylenebutenolidase